MLFQSFGPHPKLWPAERLGLGHKAAWVEQRFGEVWEELATLADNHCSLSPPMDGSAALTIVYTPFHDDALRTLATLEHELSAALGEEPARLAIHKFKNCAPFFDLGTWVVNARIDLSAESVSFRRSDPNTGETHSAGEMALSAFEEVMGPIKFLSSQDADYAH